jgi:ArsR family transcriptional regulator
LLAELPGRGSPSIRRGAGGIAVVKTAPSLPVVSIGSAACCFPVTSSVIDAPSAGKPLKALADPPRIRLISLISATEGGETWICDVTEPVALSQPTVSHHMKLLVDAGLVTRDQHGKWTYYRVVPGTPRSIADALAP